MPIFTQAKPSIKDPETQQIIKAAESLNDLCRNGLRDENALNAICDAHDKTYKALSNKQICYGKKNKQALIGVGMFAQRIHSEINIMSTTSRGRERSIKTTTYFAK